MRQRRLFSLVRSLLSALALMAPLWAQALPHDIAADTVLLSRLRYEKIVEIYARQMYRDDDSSKLGDRKINKGNSRSRADENRP